MDPPSSAGSPVPGQPTDSFNDLIASEGPGAAVVSIFGGTFAGLAANEFQYVTQGSLTAAQSETRFSVTFRAAEPDGRPRLGQSCRASLSASIGDSTLMASPLSAGGVSGSPLPHADHLLEPEQSGQPGPVSCPRPLSSRPPALEIVKTANNEDGTFNYTGSWLDSPSTFAITTSGSTGTQTFPSIVAGTYTVDELALPAGWTFGSLVCSDPTNNTTVSGDGATIVLAAGETVTCTYTNNDPPSTINVVKTANPTQPARAWWQRDLHGPGHQHLERRPGDDHPASKTTSMGRSPATWIAKLVRYSPPCSCPSTSPASSPATPFRQPDRHRHWLPRRR